MNSSEKNILAISWNIATEPALYRQLAQNPYSPHALQIISKRFPGANTVDIIRAIALAEPEGKNNLVKPVDKLKNKLVNYCNKHAKEFNRLSKENVYECLFLAALGTTNSIEIEERYSQNQRRELKLAIIDLVEGTEKYLRHERKANALRWPAIKMVFIVLSIALLSYSVNNLRMILTEQREIEIVNPILTIEAETESYGEPWRLIIPAINVNAAVEQVGLTDIGEMEVPKNTVNTGWFSFGPRPGQKGSAVIAGHFNSEGDEKGVFSDLNKLKGGDKLFVQDSSGRITAFAVRKTGTYDPGYKEEVFSQSNGAYLNLITCEGFWDETKKSYGKRLVVFTDLVED